MSDQRTSHHHRRDLGRAAGGEGEAVALGRSRQAVHDPVEGRHRRAARPAGCSSPTSAATPTNRRRSSGPYRGYESVTGDDRRTQPGRSCSRPPAITPTHVARTDVRVVEGSGTGDLVGIAGSGSYAADAMEYTMTLDYELGGAS